MSITVPYTFSNATTADALEVNANFAAILAKAFDKTGDTVTGAFAATGSFNVGAATSVVLVSSQTAGDLVYASTSSAFVRLAKGTAYQVLMTNAGATAPAWTSTLGETGTRLTAGFFTDLTVTNAIAGSVTGNAATVTGLSVTAGQTLTVTTGGTLGSAAYTASTAYEPALGNPAGTGYVLSSTSGGTRSWVASSAPSAHDLVSATHTASGLTTGHFLKATGATTYGFAAHGLTYLDVGADAAGAAAAVTPTSLGLVIGTNVQAYNSNLTAINQALTTTSSPSFTTVSANLTGNVTGNVSGTSGSTTGNAATVTGLSVTSGKTLSVSNSLTLTATDGSTLAIGTGGTLGTAAYTASTAYAPAAGSSSIVTVGTITSGIWNAGAVTSSGGGSFTTGAFSANVTITHPTNTGRLTVTGTGGGYTQADILLKTSTTDSPANRGLGIFAFNEGQDVTWFFGNPYTYGDTFVVNRKAGASFDVTASETTNSLFTLTNTGATTIAGTLTVNGFGTHAFSAGGTGANLVRVANTTSGAANEAYFEALAGTTQGHLQAFSQGYTTGTWDVQSGVSFDGNGAGGLSIVASHASGAIRFYTGGTTEYMRLGTAGDLGIAATKKFYFDGVGLSGNTYIHESAADTLGLVVGGAGALSMTASFAYFGSAHDAGIYATKKFYFDVAAGVGGDTYIYESGPNVISLVAGGTACVTVNSAGPGCTAFVSAADSKTIDISDWIYAPNIDTGTGTAVVLTAGGYLVASTSSERFKENIVRGWKPQANALGFLAVSPIRYDLKATPGYNATAKKVAMVKGDVGVIGFSAEEIHATGLPGMVNLDADGNPYSLRHDGMLAYHHLALQDHEARIAALEAKLERIH